MQLLTQPKGLDAALCNLCGYMSDHSWGILKNGLLYLLADRLIYNWSLPKSFSESVPRLE